MSFLEILSAHLYKQIIFFLSETYKHLKQSLKKEKIFFCTTDHEDEVENSFDLPIVHLKGLCSEANCLKKDLLEDCEAKRGRDSHKEWDGG